MRKLFIFLFLTFSLLCPLAAQDSNSTSEELNEQYEMFSWEPVAKAKQYGVTIQKHDEPTDTWSEYKTVTTKETQLEVLFTPGTYRVSISTYNVLGRKSKGTEWVIFKILEENVPYLNERFLPKSSVWEAPVLFINHNSGDSSDTKILGGSDAANYITSAEGYNKNTILIKGRNIFSPRTEFYLIPIDENTEGGKEYINYCDDRKEQKLSILHRNSKDYSVVVSYDPSLLYAGYYQLQVRNTGDNRDSIELLVLDDTATSIQPEKGFEVDEHYKVNTFSTKTSGVYEFSVKGKGFNSNTRFYLEPAKGTYAYPFETELTRQDIDVAVTGIYKQGGGLAQITMSCAAEELRTGYYNLIASSWDGSSSKFICLVKKPFDTDYTKQIKKLKTKYNKKTEYVDFSIQDSRFDSSKTYTLISEYDSLFDSNKRVKLNLSESGKKLTGRLSPDELTIAKYALMIEDENSYDVVYCDIDNRLKISENKMSDSAVSKTFLRPVDAGGAVSLNADGTVEYYDHEIQMEKYMPPLFTNLNFDITLLQDSSTCLSLETDILNFGFISLTGGYEYRVLSGSGSEQAVFSALKLAIPSEYFKPYIGAGIGQKLVAPEQGINGYEDVLQMFTNQNQTYAFAQAGAVLLTVLDVRYNLILENLFGNQYFTESFSFGFSFPLRSYKFKRNVLTQGAMVTKSGTLEGSDLVEQERTGKRKTVIPVDAVQVFDSEKVGGFSNYNNLKQVILDSSVAVIEENAFSDCKNLKEVYFNNDYFDEAETLIIKTNAFAGDTQIETIKLPYRTTTVQTGAFAGWTSGQIIVLAWDSDDKTERDLSGLIDCTATVIYQDDEVFHGSYKTPFENEKNWCPVNELIMKNVSVHKDDQYILGLILNGLGNAWYGTELDTWINQDSPVEILDYIKSGDKIKFFVQGDGNSYNFVLTTQGGGYFYYKFKTVQDKVVEVEIPYKKLKKYNFSSQKKLDIDSIKMCCIVPMFKNQWNQATFFDFEVSKK